MILSNKIKLFTRCYILRCLYHYLRLYGRDIYVYITNIKKSDVSDLMTQSSECKSFSVYSCHKGNFTVIFQAYSIFKPFSSLFVGIFSSPTILCPYILHRTMADISFSQFMRVTYRHTPLCAKESSVKRILSL